MLFNLSNAWAQSPDIREAAERQTKIKPLEIGDTIHEHLWNLPLQVVNHPTGKDTITLNDYRDKKLIMLDFWATWCAPCIASLKKLFPLQDENSRDFVVVPYSNENIGMLTSRMEKLSFQIFTAYGQELLNNYFPHKSIPHQIWIGDGKLIHIDDGKGATATNLIAAMEGDVSSLVAKYEVLHFDSKKPLTQYALNAETPVYLQSSLTGFIKGITSLRGISKDAGKKYLTLNNSRIFDAYKLRYGNSFDRVLLQEAESSSLKRLMLTRINYQLIVPENVSDSVCIGKLIDDLEQSFAIRASLEEIELPTIVVESNKNHAQKRTESTPRYIELNSLLSKLNNGNIWYIEKPMYVNDGDNIRISIGKHTVQDLVKDETKLMARLKINGITLTPTYTNYKVLKIKQLKN